MAICFHGYGSISLKKESAMKFADAFKDALEKFGNDNRYMCNEDGLFQFENYARHYFMEDCKQLIEDNLNDIIDGRIWFRCDDAGGNSSNPFPFEIMIEIVDGKIYEEGLRTRLSSDWSDHVPDYGWFQKK